MAAPTTKYEYRSVLIDTTLADAAGLAELNSFGAQGWRIAETIRKGGRNQRILLEREVK